MQDWAKLHTDLLDNPDIALMSAGEYQIFTFLLLLCRRDEITDGRMVGWDDKRLAYRLRKTPEEIHAAVTRLSREDIHWLEVDEEGVIWIVNYALRQYGKPSAAPEAAKVRKQKQRKREKQADSEQSEENPPPDPEASRESHAAVTPPEEKREEEKREEEKREGAAAPGRKSSAPHPLSSTPEIQLFRDITKSYPEKENYQKVYDAIKGKTRAEAAPYFAKWLEVSKNRGSLVWLLDWMTSGKPPGEYGASTKKNGRSATTDEEDRAGIRAALEGKNGHH